MGASGATRETLGQLMAVAGYARSGLRRCLRQAWLRITAVVMLAAVFLSLLTLQEAEIRREREAFKYLLTTNNWAVSQLGFELERMLTAIDRHQLGVVDGETVKLRFEILWSRVPILLGGSETAEVRQIRGAVTLLERLSAALQAVEPELIALIHGNRSRYEPVRAALEAMREPVQTLAMEIYYGDNFRRIAERTSFGYQRADLYRVAMLVVVAILAIFLGVEVLRSKRRARDEETARHLAERASAAKSTFLATMSHELRTPLNAIIGFAELQERQVFGPMPERYHGYARDIRTSAAHLLAVLNDILDMARIDTQRLDLNEELFDPAAALRAAVRMVETSATAAGVRLTMTAVTGTTGLFADQRLFRQIALNLLANAIQFTPKDGTVAVSLSVTPGGPLVLRVEDSGVGIPADVLHRVTEPFFQADQSYARRHQGTGLGLSLVQGFVHLHGGRMQIESEPGLGTTIEVAFPASRLRLPAVSVDAPRQQFPQAARV